MDVISEMIFSSLEAIIILLIYLTITNRKDFLTFKSMESSIFILVYTIFSFWITLSLPMGYHTIVITAFAIVTLSFITRTRLISSFISVMTSSVFIVVVELMIILLSISILKVSMEAILNNPTSKFIFSIAAKLVQLLLSILIYKKMKSFNKSFLAREGNNLSYYLILGIFLMGVFILSFNYMLNETEHLVLYEVLLLFIFFIYIFLGFLDFKERLKIVNIYNKFEVQKDHVDNLEAIINIIRREKHDFANHISTIYALCKINKENTVERIESYLENLINGMNESYHFFNTGNDYIDGLLAVKSSYAYEHSIYFEVDFQESLDGIKVSDNNMISIISNIIDNAFDAIRMEERKENKVVSICTYVEGENFYLSIANNGPVIPKEKVEMIFKDGYSTKHNKEDRGFGLYIVKELVSKCGGEISVNSSELETEFIVKFNLNDIKSEKPIKAIEGHLA